MFVFYVIKTAFDSFFVTAHVVVVVVSVLMLDEAHERTLFTDIAIGLLKKVLQRNFTISPQFIL